MWAMVDEGLKEEFRSHAGVRSVLPSVLDGVVRGTLAPGAAARQLLDASRT